ncbi:MAG: CotH kinase family protein [Prevotella sp.]|nr:CotH kinase family protein [Prevotella sp.]
MKHPKTYLLTALLLALCRTVAAETLVDITDKFTGHWGQNEQVTHNADGSITFVGHTWGGLSYYFDGDWSAYSRLVFEFKEPTPCAVQPIILYKGADSEANYTNTGTTEAHLDLNPQKSHAVSQAALQTASNATLQIRRIYLVVDSNAEETDDTPEANEEQDAKLMINEFMQSNIDCIMDDLREFPDSWVELYNGGTTAARLNRYSLGTTKNANEAWPLPNRKVKPDGRILVYCDKAADSLHTHFRLESGKGCEVYLFRDGELIDEVSGLKKQPAPNIAYGRKSDGSTEWGYQLTPTPKEPNSGDICDHDRILAAPIFSEEGRVVTGSHSFQLSLSAPEGSPDGTEIRFTLDGSEPTLESALYKEPIVVNSTRIVRAKLFCKGWLSPRSLTHSYIFFPRQLTLPVISIATSNQYLNDSRLGIFTNNTSERHNNWRRPINIEFFFGEDEQSAINQLCETRIAGAASRGAHKKSMAIYAHKRFGEKRFDYEFFPDQRPGMTDFKSLVLRNAGNDFDYLYMRDAIIQCTMASHTDLDWQAWQPAIVYINGQYHCMLNIRERANENNVFTHYDGLEDIDLIENWSDLKEGTWDAFNSFKTFYRQKGHTMAEYETWMDCEEFINLMAMNLYFNNFDFPGNNIIMWRPRAEGGRWRWIAKDCDYTMGLYGQGQASYKILEWLYKPNYDGQHNWGANSSNATELFRNLMDDEDFNREFIDHCAIYMGDFLNEAGIRAVWDPMRELIRYEYPYHRKLINQWWPNYDDELSAAQNWISLRTAQFYTQLASYYKLGTPIPMIVNWIRQEGDDEVGITFNGVQLSAGSFDGKFFQNRQITLEATPGTTREVTGWRVQQITNGSSTSKSIDGPLLSIQMPQCTRLVVTPVLEAASGIKTLTTTSPTSGIVYNLSGQRLSKSHKGVNIIGGHKILVK